MPRNKLSPIRRFCAVRPGAFFFTLLLATGCGGGSGNNAPATAHGEKSFFSDLVDFMFPTPSSFFDVDGELDDTFNTVDETVGSWRGELRVTLSECNPLPPGSSVERHLRIDLEDGELLVTDEIGRVYRTAAEGFLSFVAEWHDELSPVPQSGYIDFFDGSSQAIVTIREDLVIDGASCAQQYEGTMYRVQPPAAAEEPGSFNPA